MTGTRVPRVPGGRHPGRQSRDDDAARSPGHHQAAGTPAGLGPAAAAMPRGSARDDWPGWDADQAVAALSHAHYRSLVRIAALLTGDGAAAEEIVQDAFVSMHRALRRLEDGDQALGYLRRAVVSGARSQSAAPPDPRGLAGGGQPAPGIPGAVVMAALAGLPARQREALVLRYYADWPDPQVAAAMGISRHALSAHARRGMSALQACPAPDRGGGSWPAGSWSCSRGAEIPVDQAAENLPGTAPTPGNRGDPDS